MFGKIFIFVLALVVMASSIWYADTAEAQRAVEDGLVSFWTFDDVDINGDTVKDIVGGNDGTMIGDVDTVEGMINQALEFDGAGSFVDCGGDESLDLTDALTIEVWINPNEAGEGGPNAGPLCKTNGVTWNWQLRYNAPGGFMGFQFNAGGSKWLSVQENLAPGQWHHITGTFDGSDAVCYLNGEEKERISMPAISSGPDPFLIGQDGWLNVFVGVVDEVRVYDRALSENEVGQNYRSRVQLAIEPAGKLAAAWGGIKSGD